MGSRRKRTSGRTRRSRNRRVMAIGWERCRLKNPKSRLFMSANRQKAKKAASRDAKTCFRTTRGNLVRKGTH